MMIRTISLLALAGCAMLCTAARASAAETPLIAGYWTDFYDHWVRVFQQQNGVVMGTLAFGVVCLFVITRGKWRK